MEGRKLLVAQVFNREQKLLKLALKTFFCTFLRVLFLFTLLYILKSIRCSKVSVAQMTANLTGRKGMIFCMLDP